MTKEEIQKKADQIDKIYKDYQISLNQLKSKQGIIIAEFIKKLEQDKLNKLRSLLK